LWLILIHITGSETAILASAVALGAVSQSIWVSYRTARWNREQRLWQQRADIYVDLLKWAIRLRELTEMKALHEWLKDHHSEIPGMEELVGLEARVSAFSSKAVGDKVDEMSNTWMRLQVILGDFVNLDSPNVDVAASRQMFSLGIGQPEERLKTLSGEVSKWATELIELVSAELQSLKPLRH
jgi:hypothetical protein